MPDTYQRLVGNNEVLRSTSQMTTIAENRMNQEYYLAGLCDRQEQCIDSVSYSCGAYIGI